MVFDLPDLLRKQISTKKIGITSAITNKITVFTAPSLQIRRVQTLQLLRHKQAVFANQFMVEPNLSSTPFRPLDQDHVPMHRRAIPVVALLISLSGSQIQGAGNVPMHR